MSYAIPQFAHTVFESHRILPVANKPPKIPLPKRLHVGFSRSLTVTKRLRALIDSHTEIFGFIFGLPKTPGLLLMFLVCS